MHGRMYLPAIKRTKERSSESANTLGDVPFFIRRWLKSDSLKSIIDKSEGCKTGTDLTLCLPKDGGNPEGPETLDAGIRRVQKFLDYKIQIQITLGTSYCRHNAQSCQRLEISQF